MSGHLALVGATASGKSSLAVEIALALGTQGVGVEIVSADSMQVYRRMDIGTAKASVPERRGVRHHLIDLVEPSEDHTVVDFSGAAKLAIADIESRQHRALLVGGSGLYVQAVIDELEPPLRYPQIRRQLEAESDTETLWRRLVAVDEAAARQIEPNNRRRIVRALEVTLGSGIQFSRRGPGLRAYPSTSWQMVGVWLPRPTLRARIAGRLKGMLEGGFVDEVARLAAERSGISSTARQALGYRELLAHLEQGVPMDLAVRTAEQRTWAFARRQRMWWRRDPRIKWFGAATDPSTLAPVLISHWSSQLQAA